MQPFGKHWCERSGDAKGLVVPLQKIYFFTTNGKMKQFMPYAMKSAKTERRKDRRMFLSPSTAH